MQSEINHPYQYFTNSPAEVAHSPTHFQSSYHGILSSENWTESSVDSWTGSNYCAQENQDLVDQSATYETEKGKKKKISRTFEDMALSKEN